MSRPCHPRAAASGSCCAKRSKGVDAGFHRKRQFDAGYRPCSPSRRHAGDGDGVHSSAWWTPSGWRRLGPDAMAATGLTEAVVVLWYSAIAMGLAMAATATVARRIGEKDPKGALAAAYRRSAWRSRRASSWESEGAAFAPRVCWDSCDAEPAVIARGTGYARIILGGNCHRDAVPDQRHLPRLGRRGDSPCAPSGWPTLINMVLDPCFIYGLGPFPRLGVTGAAVATTTGRSLGVLYQL